MNLRDIKKDIDSGVGTFVDECTFLLNAHPGKNDGEIMDLLNKATELYNDLRNRVNKPEGNKKVYYNGLRKELTEKVESLYGQLSQAIQKGSGEQKGPEAAHSPASAETIPETA